MKILKQSLVALVLLGAVGSANYAASDETVDSTQGIQKVAVTMDNFIHADSTRAFLKELCSDQFLEAYK